MLQGSGWHPIQGVQKALPPRVPTSVLWLLACESHKLDLVGVPQAGQVLRKGYLPNRLTEGEGKEYKPNDPLLMT